MNPSVQYHGYTITIPDGLLKDFEILSLFINQLEFENIFDLMENAVSDNILTRCNYATMAAIGQNFAHDTAVGAALAGWLQLSYVEQVAALLNAAKKTEPLSCSHLFRIKSDMDDS